MIHQICPSPYDHDFPKVGSLYYDETDGEKEYEEDGENRQFFSDEINSNYSFNESEYKEPIAFFNSSHLSNSNDIKFLYMYKILEFFSLFRKKPLFNKR